MTPLVIEPGADPIIVESQYSVSRKRVYDAWTNPDHVRRWFGSQPGNLHEATIDLRRGGRWKFIEHVDADGPIGFEGEYVDVVPNERLVFTWRKFRGRHGMENHVTPYSSVTVEFADFGEGTTMRIIHSNLDAESRIGFSAGWASGTTSLAVFLDSPIGDSVKE